MYSCVWLLFWIVNIIDNIIWDPTSGIRTKVRVEAMAREEGKALGIEKFDGTDFRYWINSIKNSCTQCCERKDHSGIRAWLI